MPKPLALCLAALLLLLPPAFAGTAPPPPDPAAAAAACPPPPARAHGLAQAQIRCCEGHMGVCGCRAGRIVCCDGTVSTDPKCTCHSDYDSGLAN